MQDTERQDSWLSIAMERDCVLRSLRVALVVGTLLALINHGDKLLDGSGLDMTAWARILLTYFVPYAVATWSSVQTTRARSTE